MMQKSSLRLRFAVAAALVLSFAAAAEPLASPTWGFSLDLPEGFELSGGDRKNRFSFSDAASGASVDMVAYPAGRFDSPQSLLKDAARRLLAEAEPAAFEYRGRRTVISRLSFTAPFGAAEGWALAVELDATSGEEERKPILLMLAYGQAGATANEGRYLSALDSLSPTAGDRAAPGPVSAFAYPPKGRKEIELTVGGNRTMAVIDEADAEAAKALVDREFALLATYSDSPLWKAAWTRFYRAIWRDSYSRLSDVAFAVERSLIERSLEDRSLEDRAADGTRRTFAEGALRWVQDFKYERDLMGSDFVDLVTAALERRGDCDSRALLLAVILQRANIDAILMVSREYGHAMAGVKLDGAGAKFSNGGVDWIVAETTAKVQLGMIGKNVSDPSKWLGIDFPALTPADGTVEN